MRTALLLTALLLFIASCMASSHSESPSTAKIPSADITDLYVFRSYETDREDFITFIMNVYPLQNPNAGPNYYSISDSHFYEINIDTDGDGVEDYIYQFLYGNELGGPLTAVLEVDDDPCGNGTIVNVTKHSGLTIPVNNKPGRNGTAVSNNTPIALKFIGPLSDVYDENLNWNEYYTLTKITGSRSSGTRASVSRAGNSTFTTFPKPFDNAGEKTFDPQTNPYATYARKHQWDITVPGCSSTGGRVFVGQRAESFSLPLGRIFDLINLVPLPPGTFESNPDVGIASCNTNNDLRKNNVGSFVLELPIDCVVADSDIIGVWATVRKMIHVGNDHVATTQVSRLGQPLVNELVIGLKDKPIWSATEPRNDLAAGFAPYVLYPSLPAIIDVLFLSAVQTLSGLGTDLITLAPNVPRADLVALFFQGIPGLTSFGPNSELVEYIRLNTTTPPRPRATQNSLGVIAGDSAGYPNGRRPGDDVVDISLRAMMGVLCTINFNCTAAAAPVGAFPFTDGAPQHARQFQSGFPWLNTPLPGSRTNTDPSSCNPASSSA